jgi:glyoxylase-like metal-dependent hydrolase (beta-lactamase superfamily II)
MSAPAGFVRSTVNEIASGVFYVPDVMSNVYMIGSPGAPWLLVDAGLRGTGPWIKRAASRAFGQGARPEAIVLTHAHFDHVGALQDLAEEWNVPVWVHPLELPYVTGMADYPEPDPTVGGFMAQMSRLFPNGGINIGERARVYDRVVLPVLSEWHIIHTPGHSAGHVSFFRERDRTMIVGDAFITVNQDSAVDVITQRRQLTHPPNYLTTDWPAARASVRKLADLRPNVVATGHGLPMAGPQLASDMQYFADHFDEQVPKHGRYVAQPVVSDETGPVRIPPPVPDPVGKAITGVAVGAVAGLGIYMLTRRGTGDRHVSKAELKRSPYALGSQRGTSSRYLR